MILLVDIALNGNAPQSVKNAPRNDDSKKTYKLAWHLKIDTLQTCINGKHNYKTRCFGDTYSY